MNELIDLLEWAENGAGAPAGRAFAVHVEKGLLDESARWWQVTLSDDFEHRVEGLESSSLVAAQQSALTAWAVLEGRRWRT